MDSLVPETTTDRRPSIARLAMALRHALPAAFPHPLALPLCLLFARHLRFDSADPHWPDRDRLILDPSLGPVATALSTLLDLPAPFCAAPGPPVGMAVGSALAERLLAARFGRSLVDHRSWVVCPSADLAAGAAQEAALLAGTWRLGRLTALVSAATEDAPGFSGFVAAGWSVRRVAASDTGEIAAAMSAALRSQKPTLIACLGHDLLPPGPADPMPEEGRAAWVAVGRRGAGVRRTWLKRLARHASRRDFENAVAGRLPAGWHTAVLEGGPLLATGQTRISTAEAVRSAIARLATVSPEFVCLPGALAWMPHTGPAEILLAQEAAGPLAQGVGAAMAGMALHGGLLPLSAHSLAASDSLSAGLRAASVGALRVVENLVEPPSPCPAAGMRAPLRAMRNLHVFRPADASEALECTELALRRTNGPSVLLLSDMKLDLLAERPTRTRCAKGGYVLAEAVAPRAVTLIASGPEVHAALEARLLLATAGVAGAVVSLPCWEFFGRQEPHWQEAVLGDAPRVGIEAGSGFGWDRWLGPNGLFIGAATTAPDGTPVLTARRVADLVLRYLGMAASS